MAPEETGRLLRGPDERSDVYSLGAIFYEMLTGRPPFPSIDPVELVHAHLARNPVAPAIRNPSIPRPLSDITLRLLAKDPEARYQTSADLLADLEEVHAQWLSERTIFLPGLIPLLGEPPPVLPLGPAETQTRFHLVMQSFVHAVAEVRPLICFLDDAQWADAATLTLLRALAETPELRQCLFIVELPRPRVEGLT